MAEARVEVVKAFYDAMSEGDVDSALDLLAPDAVADLSRSRNPDAKGIHRGREEIKAMLEGLIEVWEEYELFHDEFLELGDQVLRVGGVRARGQGSGVEVLGRAAQLWTFSDGVPVRLAFFQDKDEALAAAEGE